MELEKNQILENELIRGEQENISFEKKQNQFLESTLGKVINKAVDIGISMLVPDLIEDEIIDLKDSILKNGFKEGIQTAIDHAIDMGKSIVGMVNGNFEDISQAQRVIKSGGILDTVSEVIDSVLGKVREDGKINSNVYQLIKQGKNTLIHQIEKEISEEFTKQIDHVEKVGKYINQWKGYYRQKDFSGMEREQNKIKERLKELMPLEKTLKEARQIENLHELIRNNDQKFNLTIEQEKLAEILV